jgi:NTE family protein
VRHWLDRTIGARTFADTQIPCAVTAVDLRTSTEVVIRQGLLRDAVLSTIALPGIFPSFTRDDRELVDGGLLDPVPVAVARSLVPGLPVVAVTLTTPLGSAARSIPIPLLDGLPAALASQIARLRVIQAMDIFMRSIDIGGRQIAELRFQLEKPEVIVRPMVNEIGVLERVDVHEVAKIGEEAMRAQLPALRSATAWTARLRRWASGVVQ